MIEFNAGLCGSGGAQNCPDSTWLDVDGSVDTSWVTHIDNYITALNNYQSVGVIVKSNYNTSTEVDADLMAALPEFYSQLQEA